MDSPLSPIKETLIDISEVSSPASLLESGLQCMRQGHYAEGAALFAQAREELTLDQVHIAAVLDALIQSFANYWQAQQALHEASRRFAEADSIQQTQLAVLEKLLPTLTVHSSPTASPTDHSQGYDPLQRRTPFANAIGYPEPQLPAADDDALPALYFTCFGRFAVRRLNQTITLCPNRNGQVILRYLIAQPGHRATSDTLMTMLWPDEEPEVAQPKLHIAISALRRSLNHGYNCEPGYGYILCKNRVYQLNPKVRIQTDVEEFMQCYQVGQQVIEKRAALYERACCLFTGPFLSEDVYADWSFLQREQLSRIYLAMCRELADHYLQARRYEDAAKWATTILKENRCDEAAHRYLIQIYTAQGHRSEALQQYQRCERILWDELGVSPQPETIHLFQKMLTSEFSSIHQAKI